MSTISYRGRQAVLATKHHKERAIRRPMHAAVGLDVVVPPGLDTDLLGTFTGEVEREGAPGEVVVRKARMGMAETGYRLGIASEGSFRPHAELAFETGSHELLAFVDDDAGIALVEDLFTLETNFGNAKVRTFDDLEGFLLRVGFPAHALIAAPNDRIKVGHDNRVRLVLDDVPEQQLFKGIADRDALAAVVARCAALSGDGIVHVETDMRAHLNPTRMRNIRRLAFRLARRLATPCPSCAAPGWGAVEVRRGASCTDCGAFNPEAVAETMGCVHCGHHEEEPRLSGQPCLACRHAGNT